MNKWLSEFKASWRDKNFICAAAIFALSYLAITIIAILLPAKVVVGILGAIAGWQLASWSFRIAPKLKSLLFKEDNK